MRIASIAPQMAFGLLAVLLLIALNLIGLPALVATVVTMFVMAIVARFLDWRPTALGFLAVGGLYLLGGIFFLLMGHPVLAQEAGGSTVTLPWGDWLSAILSEVILIAGTVATLLVTWALRYVPETLKAYITEQHRKAAEQLLQRAIDYAINAVRGYVTGQKLDVNVGSEVLAEALNYAIQHGPKWLIDWLGGAEKVRDKILARLELKDGVSAIEIADATPLPQAA